MTVARFPDAPPWFLYLLRLDGTKELLPDGTLNPIVRGFFKHTRFPPSLIGTKTAWCAAAASAALEESGLRSPRSAAAKDFETYGRAVEPVLGSLLVFRRSDPHNPSARHVTMCAGTAGDRFLCLGGNQANKICIALYPKGSLVASRWPENP